MNVGDRTTLAVTSMAHGGEAVARLDGRVVFVRDALPGETVVAEVTAAPAHGRFLRARTVDVIVPSEDRVTPPCAYAGRCGGCDWQHIALPTQRRLKATVVAEQLTRIGGEPADRWSHLEVEALEGDVDGLHWRTRMRYAVDATGRPGLRAHHTHDVVPVSECLIASPAIGGTDVLDRAWPGAREILAVQPDGAAVVLPDPVAGRARVTQHAADREWNFDATAFWQVHPGAADALVRAVRALLRPRPGDHLVDLYAGVGLFAGAYAETVGPDGRIDAVEADETAIKGARRSLHDLPTVHIHHDRVDRWLKRGPLRHCDLVVLDPPRTGAGQEIMERVSALRPRAIAYVACDPAALARDVAIFAEHGYRLTSLRAFDLFPMTHHLEAIAVLER